MCLKPCFQLRQLKRFTRERERGIVEPNLFLIHGQIEHGRKHRMRLPKAR